MIATVALVIACVALAVAITAAVAVWFVARQSAKTLSTLRRHRIAHADALGSPDPEPDEGLKLGPRRGAKRYTPPTGSMPAIRPDDVATGHLEQQDLPTVEAARTRPRPAPREDPNR